MKALISIIVIAFVLGGCESMAKFVANRTHQSATTSQAQGEFTGKWVSLYKKGNEEKANVYHFKNSAGRFNAEMAVFIKQYGRYKFSKTTPVEWHVSPDHKQIHTKIYNEKKTVFWALTWSIAEYNAQSGVMKVLSKIDGLKGNGSKLELRKCGSVATKAMPYVKLCG